MVAPGMPFPEGDGPSGPAAASEANRLSSFSVCHTETTLQWNRGLESCDHGSRPNGASVILTSLGYPSHYMDNQGFSRV